MKVESMRTPNGNAVSNQFIIRCSNKTVFQSYKSTIVSIEDGQVYLDPRYYNYSKTTSKYRNQFLDATTKQVEERINSGEYLLKDLNGI